MFEAFFSCFVALSVGSGMSESVFHSFFQVLFGIGFCFDTSTKQMTLQNYFLCWHRPPTADQHLIFNFGVFSLDGDAVFLVC